MCGLPNEREGGHSASSSRTPLRDKYTRPRLEREREVIGHRAEHTGVAAWGMMGWLGEEGVQACSGRRLRWLTRGDGKG